MKKYSKIIACIKWCLLFIVLFFVGRAITHQVSHIDWVVIHFDWKFLVLTIVFEMLARVFIGILYSCLLKSLQTVLPFQIAISISWISLLGKYVPGKVAVLSSTVYFLNLYKIRPAVATIVPVLGNIITIWVALMLSMPLFFSSLGGQIAPFFYMTLIVIAGTGIICFQPSIFLKFSNIMLKRMGSPPLEIAAGFFKIMPSLGVVFVQCVCAGIATWCMVRTITFIDPQQLPTVISIAALAGTMGLLALFSPAGIGVREGIYLLALTPIIGAEKGALIAVLLRLLQTLIDVIMAIIGSLVVRHSLLPEK